MNPSPSSKVCLVERNTSPGGINLVNSNAVARKSPGDVEELVMEIDQADKYVQSLAGGKLHVIMEQVRHLEKVANRIMHEARDSMRLHHAACNFKKVPGSIYHLYIRESGQTYFSMLSPEEWGEMRPHEFLGSYRLDCDKSWTPVENIPARDSDYAIINKIIKSEHVENVFGTPSRVPSVEAKEFL